MYQKKTKKCSHKNKAMTAITNSSASAIQSPQSMGRPSQHCINIQKLSLFLHIYATTCLCFRTKRHRCAMIFQVEKISKSCFFDEVKTALRCPLDAIMMLTFFDAVVIAIATCSYRDDNMMLSTCVHVVINLAICCQVEGASL